MGERRGALVARDVVRVGGPEAPSFLQGQLSQDVEALAIGATARSFLLQPTGKVDAWLRVARVEEQEYRLDVDAGFGAAVAARLRRFLLRVKVEVDDPVTWPCAMVWDGDAAGGGWYGGHDALAPDVTLPEGVTVLTDTEIEAERVAAGVPAMGRELGPEVIPGETGWVPASVSFTKGCYTGQELVARIDSRGGNVPRHLRRLRLSAAVEPGARVGGNDRCTVTSVARHDALGWVALGYVPRGVEVGQTVTVGEGAVTAIVEDLPLARAVG